MQVSQVRVEGSDDAASPGLTRSKTADLGGYEHLIVVSPGRDGEDFKAQDRAWTVVVKDGRTPMRLMAIVCDGLSQSPSSAEAADYVSTSLDRLYAENGVREIVNGLLERRTALVGSPINLDQVASPVLKAMLEEIVKEKRMHSFQTTFISVALDREQDASSRLRVRTLGCGDSRAFIFDYDGKLLYDSRGVTDDSDPIEHLSVVTEALPDSFDETASEILDRSQSYADDVHILLCSDGFYDSFATFKDIFSWLNTNLALLRRKDGASELMAELHSVLGDRRGDDDISFIWLRPRNDPSETRDVESDQNRRRTSKAADGPGDLPLARSFLSKVRRAFRLARSRLN